MDSMKVYNLDRVLLKLYQNPGCKHGQIRQWFYDFSGRYGKVTPGCYGTTVQDLIGKYIGRNNGFYYLLPEGELRIRSKGLLDA